MIYSNNKKNDISKNLKIFNSLKKGQILSVLLRDENLQLTNFTGKIVKIKKNSSIKTLSILQKIKKIEIIITFSILSPLIEKLNIIKEKKHIN